MALVVPRKDSEDPSLNRTLTIQERNALPGTWGTEQLTLWFRNHMNYNESGDHNALIFWFEEDGSSSGLPRLDI